MIVFHKYQSLIDTCLHMLSSDKGDILYLFTEGGILNQPAFELRVLYMVQRSFKKAISLLQKAHSKNKGR